VRDLDGEVRVSAVRGDEELDGDGPEHGDGGRVDGAIEEDHLFTSSQHEKHDIRGKAEMSAKQNHYSHANTMKWKE